MCYIVYSLDIELKLLIIQETLLEEVEVAMVAAEVAGKVNPMLALPMGPSTNL